jgi:hypothetical protein
MYLSALGSRYLRSVFLVRIKTVRFRVIEVASLCMGCICVWNSQAWFVCLFRLLVFNTFLFKALLCRKTHLLQLLLVFWQQTRISNSTILLRGIIALAGQVRGFCERPTNLSDTSSYLSHRASMRYLVVGAQLWRPMGSRGH